MTTVAAPPKCLSTAPPKICPHSGGKLFLPRAAYDIMDDYFLRESQWPDRRARLELARRVNAVLRCCCYSAQHVSMRFAHLRRRQDPEKVRFPAAGSGSGSGSGRPGRPSRTGRKDQRQYNAGMNLRPRVEEPSHSVVARLDVLLEEEPSPTPEIAAVWADVLSEGVMAEDIITYALLRQVKKHMAQSERVCAAAQASWSARSSPSRSEPQVVPSCVPAPSQPLRWRAPQTGPPQDPERRRKRQHWGLALPPPPPSSPSSACSETQSSSGDTTYTEGGEFCSRSPSVVSSPSVLREELAERLRSALSAPPGPRPKTFLELSTWLRESVGFTAA